MSKMQEAVNAKEALKEFRKKNETERVNAIMAIAKMMNERRSDILHANSQDIMMGERENLSSALLDRLKLTDERIDGMISAVEQIANQDQVVGEQVSSFTREDGLTISKQRVPLGVIGMIFESRPNVVIDCSALAIKSGNCIILKGGKEAKESNRVLSQIVRDAIKEFLPENVVQLIDNREQVSELLNQVGFVDVIIPRGGERLIEHVYNNSKIPVIAHFKGLCHIFVDESADLDKAIEIILNAKTQRPGVCNAMETLILHKNLPEDFVDRVINELSKKKTELRIDDVLSFRHPSLVKATDDDWATEYLENILSIKLVSDLSEAISHIQKYGSNHTEAILSQNQESIESFKNQVDASSIMVNASTRFNDGGEFGLGAEIGISTTKLHAYGPMGAREMTTTRFVVVGDGHIRK